VLRVDPTLNHIPARREHVVSLYESINQPLVNIPSHGTAPTGAYLLGTRNEHGYYTVFVYLHQPETRAVIIYVSEPRNLTADQFRVEEQEAVRFVESMGFMVDSVPFRQLAATEQDAVMGRVPIFRPPPVTVDLYEVADEIGAVDNPADPIFGGIGPGGAEVFRRAGLVNAGAMPMPGTIGSPVQSYKTPMPRSLQSLSIPQGPQLYGPTPSGQGSLLPPSQSSRESALPANLAANLQANLQANFTNPPAFGTPPSVEPSAEALQRLGRLLAAFGLAIAIACTGSACKSGGAEATEPDPQVQSQVDIGQQHLAEQHWPEAISVFADALKEQPNDRDALRGTGFAYMSLGRIEQAEPFYRRAIAADPKWSLPKNELAVLLIGTKRCDEAEQLLRTVTEDIFYPTPEFAENNLALALACEGKLDDAVARLESTVLKRPHFCLGYLTLADVSTRAKRPEVVVKACGEFETNCAQDEKIRDLVTPDMRASCYLRSGKAYLDMGDYESARTSFMRCESASKRVRECGELLRNMRSH
jgi:Tfp pilus assembly protein PilF